MRKSIQRLTASFMAVMLAVGAAPVSERTADLPLFDKIAPVSVEAASSYILEQSGWLESAYVKWTTVPNATGFEAYVKASSASTWTKLDNQLVRKYPTYFRADALGLPAGTYQMKIVPYINGTKDESKAFTTDDLTVTAHDRSGAAFASKSYFNDSTNPPGAYNADGSLKSGAQVIYVTKDTAKTVTANIITSSKGAEKITGLQAILTGKEKGLDNTPLDIRIIGTVSASDVDSFGSSEEGIQIKGKGYTEMNITIEGVGDDASVNGFGFLVRQAGNIEFRNFALMAFMDDGLSLDTKNGDVWIHNMDVFYGATGGDADQAKGDGSIDIKANSQFITVAYCHFWDSGKSSLCGMKSESGPNYITYHHNWFDHSDSRHPRIRTMSVHVYNNYFDGNAKYGVGAALNSNAFVESNYFNNCKYPMLISRQGNDMNDGKGTFSGENGGIIKAYNNVIKGATGYKPYASSDGVDFDAYEVSSRTATVPSNVTTKQGGNAYNNFDTVNSDCLGVSASDVDDPDTVPAKVMKYAGVQGSAIITDSARSKYTALTTANYYSVDSDLKSFVIAYRSPVVKIGGLDAGGEVASYETEASTEATSQATEQTSKSEETSKEASTEPTTAAVIYDYNVEVPFNNGYDFSGKTGYLVYDSASTKGAYTSLREKKAVVDEDGNEVKVDGKTQYEEKDITFNGFDGEIEDAGVLIENGKATVVDNDTIVMVKLNLPFTTSDNKYTLSGTFTPSIKGSNWTILQLYNESGNTEIGGIRINDKNKYCIRTGTNNSSLVDTGVATAANKAVDYEITVDKTAKTVMFKLTSGDSTGTKVVSFSGADTIDMLRFVTATTGKRNVTVGNVAIAKASDVVPAGNGDVYKDGAVNEIDAKYLLKYLSGINILEAKFDIGQGNCNGDEKLDILDVQYILAHPSTVQSTTEATTEATTEGTTEATTSVTGVEVPVGAAGNVFSVPDSYTSGQTVGIYTVTGNKSTSNGYAVVNGTKYTSCIKLETKTSIKVNAPSAGKLYVVFGTADTKYNLKLDDVKKTGAKSGGCGLLVLDLSAGERTITKADTGNIFYMSFVPNS